MPGSRPLNLFTPTRWTGSSGLVIKNGGLSSEKADHPMEPVVTTIDAFTEKLL